MKSKVKAMCSYGGHGIKTNGNVDLTLKSQYSELPNYIKLIQMLNNDVTITANTVDGKFGLGVFRVKEIKVDHDGEGILKFNSLNDFVETDNLNRLISAGATTTEFGVTFEADIELEDSTEDDEEWPEDEDDENWDEEE